MTVAKKTASVKIGQKSFAVEELPKKVVAVKAAAKKTAAAKAPASKKSMTIAEAKAKGIDAVPLDISKGKPGGMTAGDFDGNTGGPKKVLKKTLPKKAASTSGQKIPVKGYDEEGKYIGVVGIATLGKEMSLSKAPKKTTRQKGKTVKAADLASSEKQTSGVNEALAFKRTPQPGPITADEIAVDQKLQEIGYVMVNCPIIGGGRKIATFPYETFNGGELKAALMKGNINCVNTAQEIVISGNPLMAKRIPPAELNYIRKLSLLNMHNAAPEGVVEKMKNALLDDKPVPAESPAETPPFFTDEYILKNVLNHVPGISELDLKDGTLGLPSDLKKVIDGVRVEILGILAHDSVNHFRSKLDLYVQRELALD